MCAGGILTGQENVIRGILEIYTGLINSLPTNRQLRTFANNLDPDQARQNVGPDLDPNCLIL